MLGKVAASCVLLVGIVLAAGGAWLLTIGGSWYYFLVGLAMVATAVLLFSRQAAALVVYAFIIAITLAWSLGEVGLDWWQLAPRGGLIVLMGALLLLPQIRRDLSVGRSGYWHVPLAVSALVAILVAGYAMSRPPHDLLGEARSAVAAPPAPQSDVPNGEWHAYGCTHEGQRYSPLDQITPVNVKLLKKAWVYNTGDLRGAGDPEETTYEVTPLMIRDTVYLCTPHHVVIALDAETGAEKWRFDPEIKQPDKNDTQHLTCRGVSYDSGGGRQNAAGIADDCRERLFLPTTDARLIALSVSTGAVCPGFGGSDGSIDLWANMPNVKSGSYYSTSPPVVAQGLIIVGGAVNDNVSVKETSGVIRAFNTDTGALVWNWDSGNPRETAPIAANALYTRNSPNSWSVASYDASLGLVYVPMGNAPPDQFGANRSKDVETYSAAIVALRVATGDVAWVFQTVHHDLWDMDVPAQPSLVDLNINGAPVPALVAPTKQGDIYVLDRRSGQPLFPVTSNPAPQGAVPGDFTAPTQPSSAISFNPPRLTEASMWGLTPLDQLYCRVQFHRLRYEGRYTPPSTQGTIVYPGNFGTFNWGGVAVDPERQLLFAMPVYVAFTVKMIPRQNDTERLVSKPGGPAFNENFGAPYAAKMGPFLSLIGLPCHAPPWGYIVGVDLTTAKTLYQRVNGTVRDLAPVPMPFKMGVPGIGGPIITRGGLAFLSGTLDYFVRAYDVDTGEMLWEDRLPAGGQATPMSYWSEISQRQFVIVVAGGHGSTGTKAGDSIIAYALPMN